ncbi:hypothetical protein AAHE18_14G181200 [Arachis hypogaea]
MPNLIYSLLGIVIRVVVHCHRLGWDTKLIFLCKRSWIRNMSLSYIRRRYSGRALIRRV